MPFLYRPLLSVAFLIATTTESFTLDVESSRLNPVIFIFSGFVMFFSIKSATAFSASLCLGLHAANVRATPIIIYIDFISFSVFRVKEGGK